MENVMRSIKKTSILLTVVFVLGCDGKFVEEQLFMKSTNQTMPSVSFLNNTHYNFDVLNNPGFYLSIEVVLTPEYEINYGSLRITEQKTGLNQLVGGGTFYFATNSTTYAENYQIYRGGEFEITAEIDLYRISDNSPLTIYSEPMTMNVSFPDRTKIQNDFSSHFTATWEESKLDPGRKEYGYHILLENKELKKGELCQGDANSCTSEEYNVELESSNLANFKANPTRPEADKDRYVVALFHTHPTFSGCSNNPTRIPPGPSQVDCDSIAVRKPGVPAFVYDYEANVDKHLPIDAAAKIYPYGPPNIVL